MAYTDLTNEFFTRHGIQEDTLEELAQNDHYNRLPNGTATLFFQAAAPAKWTKSTTHNDKALRVVSGAGGGSGGSAGIAAGFSLAHSHTVNSHAHTVTAHQHLLHFTSLFSGGDPGNNFGVSSDDSDGAVMTYDGLPNIGNPNYRRHLARTLTDGGGGTMGSTSPATDSQLSSIVFSYFDAIICTKD